MPLPTSAWPLHNDSQHYNTHAASLQRSPINPAAMMSVQSAYTTGGGGGNASWSQPPSGGGTSRSYQQQPSTLQAQQYQRPPSLSSQQSQYQGGHEYAQQQPAKMLSHNASNLSAITQSYAHANSPSSANANLPTQMQYPMQPSYAYDTMASAPSPSLVSASSTSQASSSAAASYGAYPSASFAAHIPPSSSFGQGRAANAGTASQYQHATHPGGGGGSVSIHGNYESAMLSAARYPQYTYQNASAPNNNEYFVSGAASSYPDSHLHRATSSPATTSTMYADAPRGGSMFVTSPGSIYGSLPSNNGGGGGGRGIGRTMSIVHKRVPAACSFCRMRKLRCDGQEPCRQCSRRSLACVYSEGAETRRKRRATTSIVGTSSARIGEPPSVVKPLPFINSSNSSSSSAGSGTATGMYAYQPRHSPVREQWQPSPSMYARPQVTVRAPTQRMYDQQPVEQQQQQPSGTQASFQQAPAHNQHMSAHTSPEQQKVHVQQWTPTSELYALDPSSVSDTTASIAGSAALPSGLASDAFGGGNDDHAGDEAMQSSSSFATHPLSVDLLRDGGGGGDHYKAGAGKPLRPTHHHV